MLLKHNFLVDKSYSRAFCLRGLVLGFILLENFEHVVIALITTKEIFVGLIFAGKPENWICLVEKGGNIFTCV